MLRLDLVQREQADRMLSNGIRHLSMMYINLRETRKGRNGQWRNWKYFVNKAQDEEKQTKTTQKTTTMSNTVRRTPPNEGEPTSIDRQQHQMS